ncbi:MAG: ParB N-terminal domain-containing protein [Verrucomicrobia bacterium]|nr:ParB N-terminal domain-containing protein [Verrucomicrobiota bacterium]
MQVPEVFFVNPHSLREHPLLAAIPPLDEASPDFQAILASVRERGIDYPIILDEDDRIIDGRNRTRAAIRAGAELPAVKRNSGEAAEIILDSLVARRHLPKGARAYLAAPILAQAAEGGRQRRLANLKRGTSKADQSAIGKNLDQLALEMGFSKDLYEQALKVRKLFENDKVRTWHDGPREVQCTVKEWFEPKLFANEIGLGAIIQAIAGKDSTEGKELKARDLPTLFARALGDLKHRFARWESLAPDQRRTLARDFATEAAEWPEDVRGAVLASLEKAAAHPTRKPGF